MDLRRIMDWTLLPESTIEIRHQGSGVCRGHVDAVTDDGKFLWLRPPAQTRRLFEKAEFYEAWAAEDRAGFHYEISNALNESAQQEQSLKTKSEHSSHRQRRSA